MKTLEIFEYPLYWEMTNNEKIVLVNLLEDIKPSVSIEIGCKKGGSLQVISKYSKEVFSLDIDSGVKELQKDFPNVDFVIGDSKETLPKLLKKLSEEDKFPDFILIDGEHSTEGVRSDINIILESKIKKPLTIIMHDSFNPNCRRGMLTANYAGNKNLHFVDIDFLHGTYSVSKEVNGEMWGGFGMIFLKPEINEKEPEIKQSLQYSFERTLRLSKHVNNNPVSFSERVKSFFLKRYFIK